jgi:hypothetical protein
MRIAAVAFSGVLRILFYPVLTIPHVQRLLHTCGTPWLYKKSLKLIFTVRSRTNDEPAAFRRLLGT